MPGGAQAVDKVASHKKRAVFLGNIVTKNPVDQLNVELFKILRLRCASLRMTESEFVYSLRPSRKTGRGAVRSSGCQGVMTMTVGTGVIEGSGVLGVMITLAVESGALEEMKLLAI